MALFGKKIEKNLEKVNRIEVEDLIDQNFTCKEIAEQLETTERNVYFIKNAKRRREGTIKERNEEINAESPAKKAREQLEAARIELEIEKLKFETEKLKAEKEDYFGDFGEEIIDEVAENPFEKVLASMAMGFFQNKMANNNPLPQQNAQPSLKNEPPIDNKAAEVEALIGMIPEKIANDIKNGKISLKQALSYADFNKIPRDIAEIAYNKLRGVTDVERIRIRDKNSKDSEIKEEINSER